MPNQANAPDVLKTLSQLLKMLHSENDLLKKDFAVANVSDPEVAKKIGDRMNKISSILNGLVEADTSEKMAKAVTRGLADLNGEQD